MNSIEVFFSGREMDRLPYYLLVHTMFFGFKHVTGFAVFILQRLQCIWMSPIIINFLLLISCYGTVIS